MGRYPLKGYVYIITNPAWLGLCKIGFTSSIVSRLRSYQTASPKRDYRIETFLYVSDCRRAERLLHDRLHGHRTDGEWFLIHPDDARKALSKLVVEGSVEPVFEEEIRDRKPRGSLR